MSGNPREKTIPVKVGTVTIGGSDRVVIQSMTNTPTHDVKATLQQVKALKAAGAEIVRVAVPDKASLEALPAIVKGSPVPIVADIHFDATLALGAIEAGVAKVRINPGNIGSEEKVREIIRAAKRHGTAIRIGINSGSIGGDHHRLVKTSLKVLEKYLHWFESEKFDQLIISMKSSDTLETIEMNKKIAKYYPYPLHIGVTESGVGDAAIVHSSIGIGHLLLKGIGNTIRVSLPGDPVKEIPVAREILQAVGLIREGVRLIACPSCGRTQINTEKYAKIVTEKLKDIKEPIKVAIMGCVVNGPGEAKGATYALCGGKKDGLIFAHGQQVRKVPNEDLVEALLDVIEKDLKANKEESQ
jgi:(E)-4-hydroxy-3-methylbut-2-enyl-diphosphate synthase